MVYLTARNDKQLGICLRMLYSESVEFKVEVIMNDRDKIEFRVYPMLDEIRIPDIMRRYEIMIS